MVTRTHEEKTRVFVVVFFKDAWYLHRDYHRWTVEFSNFRGVRGHAPVVSHRVANLYPMTHKTMLNFMKNVVMIAISMKF